MFCLEPTMKQDKICMHMGRCDILYLTFPEKNPFLSHRKISLNWKIAKLRQLSLVTEISEFFSMSKTK